MKGEFDSPSKPTTEAYREGWLALYRPMALGNMRYGTYKSVFQQAMEEITGYPNGCPILSEDTHGR